jgi:lipoate-protein ligase B
MLEEMLLETCYSFKLDVTTNGDTGVWIGEDSANLRKIAQIGIHGKLLTLNIL